jgi:DNA modification methylase
MPETINEALTARVIVGDNRETLRTLPEGSVQTCITSPPYWGLRDYGNDDQIGLEQTPAEYVEQLCLVFDEVWRVLADDGTLWLNLGDSWMNGKAKGTLKPKDLVGIPWRVAFALQDRGWYLRSEIIWHKPNAMPEPVTDRPAKSHEHIFLLTKAPRYYYDHEAVKEEAITDGRRPTLEERYAKGEPTRHGLQGAAFHKAGGFGVDGNGKRNRRDVWSVPTKAYSGAHFAVYPPALIEPCILAGSRVGDTVLDPFSGSGTTGMVALQNGRNYVGTELNPEYAAISEKRISDAIGVLGSVEIV